MARWTVRAEASLSGRDAEERNPIVTAHWRLTPPQGSFLSPGYKNLVGVSCGLTYWGCHLGVVLFQS
jgi:hypothetical protein